MTHRTPGGGDGNACVEIATSPARTSIRDSKTPTTATLTFPTSVFAPFLAALKDPGRTGS